MSRVELKTKRVYEAPLPEDGVRILVDRLWPRGLTKDAAQIDFWARMVAPSDTLRRWYRHESSKYEEFRRRYRAELDGNLEGVEELHTRLQEGQNTLVFASREERLNNAAVLCEYLQTR